MPGSTYCYVAGNRTQSRAWIPLSKGSQDGKPSEGSFRSQSFEYALSRVERSNPGLIILLKINQNEWIRRLKDVLIKQGRLRPIAFKALSHINTTCLSAFYYLYNMRRIRKYLSR